MGGWLDIINGLLNSEPLNIYCNMRGFKTNMPNVSPNIVQQGGALCLDECLAGLYRVKA